MGVSEVIALFALFVAVVAIWQSSQSIEKAQAANDVAKEGNTIAREAIAESRSNNVLMREANGIAHLAKSTADKALSHSQDVALKEFRARFGYQLDNQFIRLNGNRGSRFTLVNEGRVPAHGVGVVIHAHDCEPVERLPFHELRVEPGATFTFLLEVELPTNWQRQSNIDPWCDIGIYYRDLFGRHITRLRVIFDRGVPIVTEAEDDGKPHLQQPDPEWLELVIKLGRE